jgi:hypothetical protein
MLSLATNTVVRDGVAPNAARTRPDFPYYREPSTRPIKSAFRQSRGTLDMARRLTVREKSFALSIDHKRKALSPTAWTAICQSAR